MPCAADWGGRTHECWQVWTVLMGKPFLRAGPDRCYSMRAHAAVRIRAAGVHGSCPVLFPTECRLCMPGQLLRKGVGAYRAAPALHMLDPCGMPAVH